MNGAVECGNGGLAPAGLAWWPEEQGHLWVSVSSTDLALASDSGDNDSDDRVGLPILDFSSVHERPTLRAAAPDMPRPE